MSRVPFWQPGDRWQPPIVRIKGVDEKSPAGQQLMRAYEGTIKQFYLGQARAYALGINENSRGRKQFPDATMTYTNIMGQEIVDIELRPEVVERVEERVRRRIIPQWAIVNFTLSSDYTTPTLGSGNSFLHSVRMEADVLGFEEFFQIRSRGGGNWAGGTVVSPYRRAAFAGSASGINTTSTTALVAGDYTTSLLIDLRPYGSDPAAVAAVDIYAMTERKTYEQGAWVATLDRQDSSATQPGDPTLADLPLGFDAGKASFLSRGYSNGYERLYILGQEIAWLNYPTPDDVAVWDSPRPPPVKQLTSLADPLEHLGHVSWTLDAASGLISQLFYVAIRRDDEPPGQSSTRWGPVREYYNIDPIFGYFNRIHASPSTVSARLFYGTPDEWRHFHRTKAAGLGNVTDEYLWAPSDVVDAETFRFGTIANGVPWPVPREFRIDENNVAIEPGPATEGTKLGTITCVVEEGVIAFAPATQ